VVNLSTIKLGVANHSSQLLLSHRRLLWQVALNELKARYAGSVFGVGWQPQHSVLEQIVGDAWAWFWRHSEGYGS
jgi:hypothetical protein